MESYVKYNDFKSKIERSSRKDHHRIMRIKKRVYFSSTVTNKFPSPNLLRHRNDYINNNYKSAADKSSYLMVDLCAFQYSCQTYTFDK